MRKLAIAAAGAALIALLALAPTALAGGSGHRCSRADRNHDRIPDRWECAHHLSLRVKQTRRDPDHDGLNNLGEFRDRTNPRDPDTDNDGLDDGDEVRAHLNPRDPDTDNDGDEDGDEGAGTVDKFENGVLTIKLFGGSTLTGQVTAATEIECEGTAPLARASEDGGDHSGPGGGDDNSGPGSTNSGPGDAGEVETEDENEQTCSTADLTTDTTVREAELQNGVFEEVELVK